MQGSTDLDITLIFTLALFEANHSVGSVPRQSNQPDSAMRRIAELHKPKISANIRTLSATSGDQVVWKCLAGCRNFNLMLHVHQEVKNLCDYSNLSQVEFG